MLSPFMRENGASRVMTHFRNDELDTAHRFTHLLLLQALLELLFEVPIDLQMPQKCCIRSIKKAWVTVAVTIGHNNPQIGHPSE
jgi:hypothetical protein